MLNIIAFFVIWSLIVGLEIAAVVVGQNIGSWRAVRRVRRWSEEPRSIWDVR